jgi:TetR/AcrR family transcriptional regulator, cholesterol catabolism regulator
MSDVLEARPRGRPTRFPERQYDVLRTAARIIGLRGFRQATLSDIAEALDMTRPALYHYAGSKDELFAQCAAIAAEQLESALDAAHREANGLAQLHSFFVRYAEITCDDFGRCFVLVDRSEMTPDQSVRSRDSQLRIGRAVADMARTGMHDGSMRNCDPVAVSRALFGIFNGMARWYQPKKGRSPSKIAVEFLSLFTDGLRPL